MEPKLDLLFVDAFMEVIDLREAGLLEDMDGKSQDLLVVMAAHHARGEPAVVTNIVSAMKATASYSTTVARLRKLVGEGWLVTSTDTTIGRSTVYHLTPKAIQHLNSLSQVIRNHYGITGRRSQA